MNLVEFMFAFAAVFGSTAVFTLWQLFMYKLDKIDEKTDQRNIQTAK